MVSSFKISFLIMFCWVLVLPLILDAQIDTQIDTSRIAIFQGDPNQKTIDITSEDVMIIDSLIIVGVNTFNSSSNKADQIRRINLNMDQYKKQLIVSWNENKEVEVSVNCLCNGYGDRWKRELFLVKGGGSCYFRLRINLITKSYFNFLVNGSE